MVVTLEEGERLRADAEMELASRSFPYFLEHVMIMEPPPGRAQIPFATWGYLGSFARDLGEHRLLSVLKARQLGFSWIVAAYAIWTARFHEAAVVLMLSKGQGEATALLQKCKFVLDTLPESWATAYGFKGDTGTNSRSEISFPALYSKVLALPATENAGRSETATVVIQDEADFHEHLEASYAAFKPTIDAGGQLIMGSTSNKKRMVSLFKEVYRGAPKNGFKAVFWPWHVRPGRDEGWYERTRDAVPATAEMGPDLYMEQEYPGSADEALSPARSIQEFDQDALKEMEQDCINPVERRGPINFYQRWRVGQKYACGTDPSHGVGMDNAVSVVLNARTGMVVADIVEKDLGPEQLAYETMRMLEEYKRPIWGIEDNDWGIATVRKAQDENYPRLYKRKTGRGSMQIGWHTDRRSRRILWTDLREAVAARQLIIPNKMGLSQFYTVIRDPVHDSVGAMSGANDDYPVAVGIALQMPAVSTFVDVPSSTRKNEGQLIAW